MYNTDYIMRMIEMATRLIGETIFHKSIPAVELFEEEESMSSTGVLYHRLRRLVAAGEIEDAEQILFDELEMYPHWPYFQTAMQFYQDLNRLSEAALTSGGFSRREIQLGIIDVCRLFDIDPDRVEWE